jgi:hypothetical protein
MLLFVGYRVQLSDNVMDEIVGVSETARVVLLLPLLLFVAEFVGVTESDRTIVEVGVHADD